MMKKVISIILAVSLLLSLLTVTVFAQDTQIKDLAENFGTTLDEIISVRDPERWVAVSISFNFPKNTSYEKTRDDFDTSDAYERYRREADRAYAKEQNEACVEILSQNYEVNPTAVSYLSVSADVKVKDIEAIRLLSYVKSMYYVYENDILLPRDQGYPVIHNGRFFDRFLEFYHMRSGGVAFYDEEYYHFQTPEDESSIDWAIVRAVSNGTIMSANYQKVIRNRFIYSPNLYGPFIFGYALYDVEKDEFIPFDTTLFDNKFIDLSAYDGLEEVFDNMKFNYPACDMIETQFLSQNGYGMRNDADYTVRTLANHIDNYNNSWALVEAHAETELDYMREGLLSVRIGRHRLVSRQSSWPYYSKLAVCFPYRTESASSTFYGLDELDLKAYEGLEEAIMAQDLDALGFDVESAFAFEDQFISRYYPKLTVEDYEKQVDHVNYDYDELYYHHDENGAVDWTLVYNCCPPTPWVDAACTLGDRFLRYSIGATAFNGSCYAVYDVEKDTFIDCSEINPDDYDGLIDIVNTLKIGYEIGDADLDGTLSVLDATRIQRMLAGLYPVYDDECFDAHIFNDKTRHDFDNKKRLYLSDIDRDGQRTIMDATRIQKILAGIFDRHGNKDEDYLTTGSIDLAEDTVNVENPISYESKYSYFYKNSNVDWDRPLEENKMQATLITSYTQFRAFYQKSMSYYYDGFFDDKALIDINVNLTDTNVFNYGFAVGVNSNTLEVKLVGKTLHNDEHLMPNRHSIIIVKKSDIKSIDSIRMWTEFVPY